MKTREELSAEVRARQEAILRLAALGLSRVAIAMRLGISRQTVWRVLSQ